MSRTLSALGILITVAYLGLLLFVFGGRAADIYAMKPNEIGDFLAGIFGPLAILWLILGFFQQGIELRQNTRALHHQEEALQAQVSELQNSVQQQKELVDVAKRQLEEARNAWSQEMQEKFDSQKPVFVLTDVFSSFDEHIASGKSLADRSYLNKPEYVAKFRNIGGPARDVSIQFSEGIDHDRNSPNVASLVLHGEVMECGFHTKLASDKDANITIECEDIRGFPRREHFAFTVGGLFT